MSDFILSTDFAIENKKEPVTVQIYRFLKQSIIECRLMPGDLLSENNIASCFKQKLSRQPVREAMIRLNEQGFIIVNPKKATCVAPISKSKILKGIDVRIALEGQLIRKAATQISENQIKDLEHILFEQKRAGEGYALRDLFFLDDKFHELILDASSVDRAWPIVESIKNNMDRVRYISLENDIVPIDNTVNSHEEILQALKEHDADKCEKFMTSHIKELGYDLLKTIENSNKKWFCE